MHHHGPWLVTVIVARSARRSEQRRKNPSAKERLRTWLDSLGAAHAEKAVNSCTSPSDHGQLCLQSCVPTVSIA